MCGIFGYVGTRDEAPTLVLDGLKKLEYRGYDSWGIAARHDGLLVEKHVGKIGQATTSLPGSSAALGHTRWATHGGVTEANAHPHLDCQGRLAVIHNGIIENHEELKRELLAQGHTFASQTDTEVVCHLLEEQLKERDDPVDGCERLLQSLLMRVSTARRAFGDRRARPRTALHRRGQERLAAGARLRRRRQLPGQRLVGPARAHAPAHLPRGWPGRADQRRQRRPLRRGRGRAASPRRASGTSPGRRSGPTWRAPALHGQGDPRAAAWCCAAWRAERFDDARELAERDHGREHRPLRRLRHRGACRALWRVPLFERLPRARQIASSARSSATWPISLTRRSLVVGLSQSGETIDLLESMKAGPEARRAAGGAGQRRRLEPVSTGRSADPAVGRARAMRAGDQELHRQAGRAA